MLLIYLLSYIMHRSSLPSIASYLLSSILDNERTTLNGVNDHIPALEQRVRAPAPNELQRPLVREVIVLRVRIEEPNLLDALTRGITGNARDINDAQTGTIMRLPRLSVVDVLVVIDSVLGGLEQARLLGVAEIGDIPDVGDSEPVGCGSNAVILVVLVVHDQEALIVRIEDPALVGVGGALVASARDDGGVSLIGDVVDREGVLVVTVADINSTVALIRAAVLEALRIVDVSILGLVAGREGLRRVGEIDEDHAALESAVAGGGADGDSVLEVGVDNDIVGAADGELAEDTRAVLNRVEGVRLLPRLDLKELVEVEDLDVVVHGFGANDGEVVEDADLAPDLGLRAGGVGETAEIVEFAVGGDAGEGGAIGLKYGLEHAREVAGRGGAYLGNDDVLLAVLGPTPRAGALAGGAAELGVRVERVEIDVLAPELSRLSVLARGLLHNLGVLLLVKTLLTEVGELPPLGPHDLVVDLARVIFGLASRVPDLLCKGRGGEDRQSDERELHDGWELFLRGKNREEGAGGEKKLGKLEHSCSL